MTYWLSNQDHLNYKLSGESVLDITYMYYVALTNLALSLKFHQWKHILSE